jgi:hypothetical protein
LAFLSQSLEWVRAVLFGPRVPGRHRRTSPPRVVFPALSTEPSPDVWGAQFVVVRAHRREAPAPLDHPGVLVRPYVACLGADVYATAECTSGGERLW